MKNIIKKIKNSKGYVGIEVVLIAGMIIGFGVVVITHFRTSSTMMTEDSFNRINNSIEDMHVNTNFNN